ncbi:hypothetical protein TNCV_1312681 [Trichonephila clavipes]|nr:hypothetical protein TNCV_1312681 [Trichonephila clavipes]
MSLCIMEFYACCISCILIGTISVGCDDAGVVIQSYLIRAQLETYMITTSDVGPVCLGHRQFGCKRSSGLLLIKTRPVSGTKAEPSFNRKRTSPPMSTGLTPRNGNGLESVEYTIQGISLGTVLEVTNF